MMEAYYVLVPSTEGKLLSQLKNETILQELVFEEDKQMYICKGFAYANQSIAGQLRKYSV
jgi:GTP-binding protein HflX